jgi:hypothetical protein
MTRIILLSVENDPFCSANCPLKVGQWELMGQKKAIPNPT